MCFFRLIWFSLAINIEVVSDESVLLARAALCGVLHLLKNDNAGFEVSPGLHNRQLRGAQILLQNRSCPSVATFVVQRLASLLVLPLLMAVPTLWAQVPGNYRVNAKESQIEIHLFKGGFLSALGDNHIIALAHFSGTANLSRTNPWKAELSGDAASLKVIDPGGTPSERKEVQDIMLGPQQLDVTHFPSIELHSLLFDPTNQDTTWRLEANVTLHGATRKTKFSLDCRQTGDQLQIRGKKMFKLTDFNVRPFSTAFGAVKVKNDFEVTYYIILDRIP